MKGGDVYPVETNGGFRANQVLDAHWGVLDDDDDVSVYSFLLNGNLVKFSFHLCIYIFMLQNSVL